MFPQTVLDPRGPKTGENTVARPHGHAETAVPGEAEFRLLRVGIALFPGAEELDWAGPWEVFGYWATRWPNEAEAFTIAETLDPMRSSRGLRVLADRTWSMSPVMDVLIYPGGPGVRRELSDPAVLRRLRDLHEGGVLVASVCTGSLVLAASGLLDHHAATTHWQALDDLRQLGTAVDVRPDERFVDAGDVVTAAGVSAGIDLALALVKRLHSPGRARAIRRAIQYDPAPPV